jgi:hypothetical protein
MVRVAVVGRVDGAHGGTVTIDRKLGLLAVRPKGRRRTYELPLAFVAEMVVAKVVKQELMR